MFEGFSQEALDFLNDIRFNNNQAFYEANQARYERFVKRPMRELSDELAPVVQLIDPISGSCVAGLALSGRGARRRLPYVLGLRAGLARLGMRLLLSR